MTAATSMTAEQERDRQADQMLDETLTQLRGLRAPLPPREMIVLVTEDDTLIIELSFAPMVFADLGLTQALGEIEAERTNHDDLSVPVVIIVDSGACVAWTRLVPLTPGGSA